MRLILTMTSLEQKPESSMMREVPADESVPKNDHSPSKPREIHFEFVAHKETLYTFPSAASHYMDSDLNRDIMENPSLGFADF